MTSDPARLVTRLREFQRRVEEVRSRYLEPWKDEEEAQHYLECSLLVGQAIDALVLQGAARESKADEPRRVKPPMMGPPYDPVVEQHRDRSRCSLRNSDDAAPVDVRRALSDLLPPSDE